MKAWRSVLAACGVLGLLGIAPVTQAQRVEAPEPAVKAAFLYKFANYVEWSANAFTAPGVPLVIGVLAADDIATELERIVPGRLVNGHPIAVRRLREGEPLRGVHIVFIGKDSAATTATLRSARQQSVLAVTDTDQGLEMGSAINFVPAGDRLAFEVSLDSAEKSGHRISARMLAVARRVLPRS